MVSEVDKLNYELFGTLIPPLRQRIKRNTKNLIIYFLGAIIWIVVLFPILFFQSIKHSFQISPFLRKH